MDVLDKLRWAKKKAEELADSIDWIEKNIPFLYTYSPADPESDTASHLSQVIDHSNHLKQEILDCLTETGIVPEWKHPSDLLGRLGDLIDKTESRQIQNLQDLKRVGTHLAYGRVHHKLRRVRDELNELREQAAQELLSAKGTSPSLPGPGGLPDWLSWFWNFDDDADTILEGVELTYPHFATFLQAVTREQWQEAGLTDFGPPPATNPEVHHLKKETPEKKQTEKKQTKVTLDYAKAFANPLGFSPPCPPEQGIEPLSGDSDLDSTWANLCATDWVGLAGGNAPAAPEGYLGVTSTISRPTGQPEGWNYGIEDPPSVEKVGGTHKPVVIEKESRESKLRETQRVIEPDRLPKEKAIEKNPSQPLPIAGTEIVSGPPPKEAKANPVGPSGLGILERVGKVRPPSIKKTEGGIEGSGSTPADPNIKAQTVKPNPLKAIKEAQAKREEAKAGQMETSPKVGPSGWLTQTEPTIPFDPGPFDPKTKVPVDAGPARPGNRPVFDKGSQVRPDPSKAESPGAFGHQGFVPSDKQIRPNAEPFLGPTLAKHGDEPGGPASPQDKKLPLEGWGGPGTGQLSEPPKDRSISNLVEGVLESRPHPHVGKPADPMVPNWGNKGERPVAQKVPSDIEPTVEKSGTGGFAQKADPWGPAQGKQGELHGHHGWGPAVSPKENSPNENLQKVNAPKVSPWSVPPLDRKVDHHEPIHKAKSDSTQIEGWDTPPLGKPVDAGHGVGFGFNSPNPKEATPKVVDPWAVPKPGKPGEMKGQIPQQPIHAPKEKESDLKAEPWAQTPAIQKSNFTSAQNSGLGSPSEERSKETESKGTRKGPSWMRPKKPAIFDLSADESSGEIPALPVPAGPVAPQVWGKDKTPVGEVPPVVAPASIPVSENWKTGPGINDPVEAPQPVGGAPMSAMEAMLRGTTPMPESSPSSSQQAIPASGAMGALVWEKPPPEKAFSGGKGANPLESLAPPQSAPGSKGATWSGKQPSSQYVNGANGPSQEYKPYTNGAHANGNGAPRKEGAKSLFSEPPRGGTRMRETGTRSSMHGSILEIASSRRMIRNDPWLRSPLNSDQEAFLTDPSNGVVVVFGSRLSGLEKLMDGIREIPNLAGVIAAGPMTEAREFENWISEVNRSLPNIPPGTALAVVDSSIRWSVQWIKFASDLLRRRTDQERFLRVVFVADPSHDWTWTGDEERRELGAFELTLRQ